MNIGHNSWLSVNLEKDSALNISAPFSVSFNASPSTMTFNEAADYTANLIASKFDNLHLCLSGGLDSEFVAKVLLRNNISFTPVIVSADFVNAENWYAFKFCNDNNITPLVLDFTGPEKHIDLAKQLIVYARQHSLPFDRALLVNIVADLLPTASILTGYGDPVHVSSNYNEPVGEMVELTDHDYFLDTVYGNAHPGAFFSYTPELFYAMVRDLDTTKNTQDSKLDLYNLLWRPKMQSPFFELYPSSDLAYIIKHALKTIGKLPEHQAYFINRYTLLN